MFEIEKKSQEHCAKFFKISRGTVVNILRKARVENTQERRAGSGRKRKTTWKEDELLVLTAKRQRSSTAEELCEVVGVDVSRSTVQRRLKEVGGLRRKRKSKKPLISEVNRRRRLAWARKYKDWTFKDWSKVLFSDESPFTLKANLPSFVWVGKGEELQPFAVAGNVKHPKKINVWGCFSARGVGVLHRIEGTMTK
jgi:transposase